MTIYDTIHNRRSVRPGEYTDAPVSREVIERLIGAANAAPTHRRLYPWRFIVFDSASAKTELGEFFADLAQSNSETPIAAPKLRIARERPSKAAAAIAIVMKPDLEKLPEWEEVSATAAAVQNLWLALSAEGLVGYWSSPGPVCRGDGDKFLGLAEGEKCLGVFYLGHPAGEPAPIERPKAGDKVVWR
ncbi:MAG: nitroreductase [Saprospiraceae bacterium]